MSARLNVNRRDGEQLDHLVTEVEQLVTRARARLDAEGLGHAQGVLELLVAYTRTHCEAYTVLEEAWSALPPKRQRLEMRAAELGAEAGATLRRARKLTRRLKVGGSL